MTIGELAKQADVGVETIRFYERQGLIPKPPRTPSGYRKYPGDTVPRLRFIQRAKELGFSLREIQDLFSLQLANGAGSADVKARAEAKTAEIEDKIRYLERMKDSLTKLTEVCNGSGTAEECPILDALSD